MSPPLILLIVTSIIVLLWALLRIASVMAGLIGIVETRYVTTEAEAERNPRQRLIGLILLVLAVAGLTVFIIALAASPPV